MEQTSGSRPEKWEFDEYGEHKVQEDRAISDAALSKYFVTHSVGI